MKIITLTNIKLIEDLTWICNIYSPNDMCEMGKNCGYIMEYYIEKELKILTDNFKEPVRLWMPNNYKYGSYIDIPKGYIIISELYLEIEKENRKTNSYEK